MLCIFLMHFVVICSNNQLYYDATITIFRAFAIAALHRF